MSFRLTFKNTNQTYSSPVVKQETKSSLDAKIAVVYHGTSEDAAENIKKHGLNCLMRWENGTTLMLNKITEQDDKECRSNSYVTTDPSEAAKYAKCHTKPCIVSMICPRDILKKDSQSGTDTAFKVKKISRNYLLPSKKEKLSEDKINIIKKQLKEDGIYLKKTDDFNFIEKNWKDPEKYLKKCNTSAVEEVAQSQRRITDHIFDRFGLVAPGTIISINPEMLESFA